ncbi:MAG: hypothetical protein ACTSPI_15740, partial [Candidatus Heimdallarchaeaceae archaeon]
QTYLLAVLVLFSGITLIPSSAETNEINGIYYSYDVRTFQENGAFTYFDMLIVDEEFKDTTIYTGPLDLVIGYDLVDALYLIIDYRYFS